MGLNFSQETKAQSVPFEKPSSDDESWVYINSIRLKENGGRPITTFRIQPNSKTITAIVETSAKLFRDLPCLGERSVDENGNYGLYYWISYHDFYEKCLHFASGLEALGIEKGDRVGIYSPSCAEWQISFIGILFVGAIPVTVYESFGNDAARFIIEQSRLKVMILDSKNISNANEFLEKVPFANDLIKIVIKHSNFVNTPFNDDKKFFLHSDIIENGKNREFHPFKPKPDDIAIIMYTSGTVPTTPKGCVLTHRNLVAGATGLGSAGSSINTKDTYFSYLPLAHIYELCCHLIMFAHGVRIGFYSGDVRDIFRDCKCLQPTIVCGVPRVFNRLVDIIKRRLNQMNPIVRWATLWAIDMKSRILSNKENYSMFVDFTLLRDFMEELGGRLRIVVVGGAPILPEIYNLLRATITPNLIQGYGLTEISAAGCVSDVRDSNPASVGPVSIAVDMKFRRVEGMDYDPTAREPSGELLFRGSTLFKGYLITRPRYPQSENIYESDSNLISKVNSPDNSDSDDFLTNNENHVYDSNLNQEDQSNICFKKRKEFDIAIEKDKTDDNKKFENNHSFDNIEGIIKADDNKRRFDKDKTNENVNSQNVNQNCTFINSYNDNNENENINLEYKLGKLPDSHFSRSKKAMSNHFQENYLCWLERSDSSYDFNDIDIEIDSSDFIDGEWYPTGDIGILNPDGRVQIIDRVKQLVKLSHGEYISLSNLSTIYGSAPGVKYIFVYADSHHNQPVAVVVPTDGLIADWCGRGITSFQTSSIAKSEMMSNLNETADKINLRSFEKMYDIILDNDAFSMISPSLKPHIRELRAKYEGTLLELYSKGGSKEINKSEIVMPLI
ncbi:hypothetical protein TRFO_28034 [Tritrichomonas foetus]|uniref:AMP-dependent synthetase/ligase domain-containing protein n=1 Tax=Tritrichomonas foetus TaxID=1144522 RepID=A0A1J4K110_9EUKA|nr:hypothetical protein TRFO_28034 [Tritrichomonas foetus]|eukprot:OHT04472.1 hypothetical protein TRFO_28034 [Tritrichomonas foetus]